MVLHVCDANGFPLIGIDEAGRGGEQLENLQVKAGETLLIEVGGFLDEHAGMYQLKVYE